ncbi:MAG: hypothetical protein JW784_00200 [Candidatus Cloacimonetes bacterium]|nr:hypothetical protein [Candidatus Cloacimonadota bacterium]
MECNNQEYSMRTIPEVRAAWLDFNLQQRSQISIKYRELLEKVPESAVNGNPFLIMNFISSYPQGYLAEIGIPVQDNIEIPGVAIRIFPEYSVFSHSPRDGFSEQGVNYSGLFEAAYSRGLVSDEFCREEYTAIGHEPVLKEIQFVIHDWGALFMKNLNLVTAGDANFNEVNINNYPGAEAGDKEKFSWLKQAVTRLDEFCSEAEQYKILSRCAHVFPVRQIAKLREVYLDALAGKADQLVAVDRVIAFMAEDPGWIKAPERQGRTIINTKNPSNPQAYKEAKTQEERNRAYCFCPLIKDHLDQGLSPTFCYCSAGWERQQWEGVFDYPVKVRVLKSLLRGDTECQFAIEIPETL